jgi:Zn-dependent protease
MLGSIPTLLEVVMMIPGVVIGFTFHEFGHALVATWFGDDTPKAQGRLTLDPRRHLDPIGTILLLLGSFGWAKPVQVNVSRLKPRIIGDICVSLAGVTINFLLAVLFALAFFWLLRHDVLGAYRMTTLQVLETTIHMNILLVGFNLLPLPPLDGFRVVRYLVPPSMDHIVAALYRFGPIVLILFFMSGYGGIVLSPVYRGLYTVINSLSLLF